MPSAKQWFLKRVEGAVTTIVTALFLCGLLGILASPLIAGWYALDGEHARERFSAGSPVNNAELVSAMRALEVSLRVHSNPSAWFSLGLLQAVSLSRVEHAVSRDLLRRRAIDSHKAGLSGAAIDPAAWFRLARLRTMGVGPTRRAGQALVMSLRTAPNDRSLAFSRTEFGLQIQEILAPEARELLFHQIRTAWHLNPERTVSLAVESNGVATLTTVLADDETARNRLLEILRESPR